MYGCRLYLSSHLPLAGCEMGVQRCTCIKGVFWPPFEPKTENCVSSISSDFDSLLLFTLTVAMVTKMADEIGLK